MNKTLITFFSLTVLTLTLSALASEQTRGANRGIVQGTSQTRVTVGPTYGTTEDLIYRIRILEQAVSELQQQCGSSQSISVIDTQPQATWTCKVMTRKEFIYGSGISRGTAEQDAMEKCYKAQGDGAFCKIEECSNQ